MRPPFLILIALFAFPIVLSWPLAQLKQAAFFSVVQIVQMILLYIALAGELQRPTAIVSLMKGLALGLILQAGYVISQKMTGVVQPAGTAPHQNILGMMVVLSVLPLIATAIDGIKNKLIYLGVLAGLIAVAGGGSRGALAFLALALVVFLILTFARRTTQRKIKFFGVMLLACVAAVPIAIATLENRFGDSSVFEQETQRAALERAARAMAAEHPLGVGANNFVTVNNLQGFAARAGLDWAPSLRSKPVHNAYLLARAETGWAGQIGLILLFGGIVAAGIKTGFRRRKDRYIGLALGSAAATIAVAFHSAYEYAIYLPEVQRLFFMNAALIAACMAFARKPGLKSRVQHSTGRGERPSDARSPA